MMRSNFGINESQFSLFDFVNFSIRNDRKTTANHSKNGRSKKIKQKLSYINVEYDLIWELTLKPAIILKVLCLKCDNRKGSFPCSFKYLYETTGISRNTVKKALIILIEKGFITIDSGNIFLVDNIEDLFHDIKTKYIANEISKGSSIKYDDRPPYVNINFKLYKDLNLNLIEYCFLQSIYSLSRSIGRAYLQKEFMKRIFHIEERQFFNVKRKLHKDNRIEKYGKSDYVRLNQDVSKQFKNSSVKSYSARSCSVS